MSGAPRLAKEQPESFAFTQESLDRIQVILKRYPEDRKQSAVLPLLDIAQRQENGWISRPAIECVADMLEMPVMRVLEVASFYTMCHLKPVGKYHLQVCTTTPCWLRGSGDLMKVCQKKLGLKHGETSKDGTFSVEEVECLGACVNAPIVQINDDYFEDVDKEQFEKILDDLAAGKDVQMGPQVDRQASAPVGGPKALKPEKKKE